MNDEEQKDLLYQEGLKKYKESDYFEAHELWEDLWSDFYLEDRKFIQGLIQLSVSFVHLERGNINGARSLLNKSKGKFIEFSGIHRKINVQKLLSQIELVKIEYENLDHISQFDWEKTPDLN
mgnify:CR=1 FL=1